MRVANFLFIPLLFGLISEVFALPKSKIPEAAPGTQQPAKTQPAPFTPVVADEEEMMRSGYPPLNASPTYRYLGPSQIEQAASPYVDVRVGIPETPGGNNHMRRQAALSPNGVVHMVYGVYEVDSTGTPDSARNFLYFYNAYDCSGSNALRNGSLDAPVADSFPPADPRPRFVNQGGLFIPSGTTSPVVYGRSFILGPPTGRTARGQATVRDSGECLAMFSMDTTMGNRTAAVAYPLNESVWVATYRAGNAPSLIAFNHTTDRGLTWSTDQILSITSPWFNSTEIAGNGNTFYIVAVGDPHGPVECFTTCERPIYQKGIYNPSTGGITFGAVNDITGDFELPGYKTNFLDVSALMVGDTLHVLWTDWNNYSGNGFPGPGGHVHHAAVWPDGTVQGPHKITNINIDGRLPDRSYTLFGLALEVWPMVSLSYDSTRNLLFALWSAPPDDGNFGWGDYEATQSLACYDIFKATSPNNGRAWDEPRNVTRTNNPGCDGSPGNPCHHEDHFEVAAIANDTIWVVAMVQRYPGFQETAVRTGITPDPGPFTEHYDVFRLYKVPALPYGDCFGPDLSAPPGDTTKFFQIQLQPRGGTKNFTLRLSNICVGDLYIDSVTLYAGLNDGYLVTTTTAVPGTFVPDGGFYDFSVSFNTDAVGPGNVGVRSGFLRAYVHSVSPAGSGVVPMNITVYIVPTLCFNRKTAIHSATNRTDVGNQGSIKDQGGYGMYYPANEHDNFYDGGVWIANSALNAPPCATGPRKVTRQLFNDKFLQCVTDGILDSVPGTGSYYNLYVKSIATDVHDTTLVWQNIWEQSTHPDSSDFLLQTTRVINISNDPIDSVAMGVIYDIDVSSPLSFPSSNLGGDTIFQGGDGRHYRLAWISGSDNAFDNCGPNNEVYGAVVIPGETGSPGDTVGAHGLVVYKQSAFAYNIDCGNASGGDSLAQRYAWNLRGYCTPEDGNCDTLTGYDSLTLCIQGGLPPYDLGYLAIAKKVYNLPPNGGGSALVARYGLDALAAAVDTFFSGPGESYTIIHVATSGGGLTDLMANAVKGIDWYVNHADLQVGTSQTRFRGDLNNDGGLSPSDVVLELNYVFLNEDVYNQTAIPLCVADLNNSGDLSPADVVLLLNGTFTGSGCAGCLKPCL